MFERLDFPKLNLATHCIPRKILWKEISNTYLSNKLN